MKALNVVKSPYTSLTFNITYAVVNCIIGFIDASWWFITVGAYYIILAITRYFLLQLKRKPNSKKGTELFVRRSTGVLLVALSFCIVGVNIMSAIKERGTVFHEIVMITIATYTFTKITVSIIGMAKTRHCASPITKSLRNISLADACVSVYSMQRSMLVSFPSMESNDVLLLNIFTGTAVWIFVLLLGINLIGGKYTYMAKSKIVKANKKIADTVIVGYKKIEKGVVGGYKKIEHGVTKGYTKIEDKFVDAYLTREGETVEQAKERLKNKNNSLSFSINTKALKQKTSVLYYFSRRAIF